MPTHLQEGDGATLSRSREDYMWAGSLKSQPLKSIPCYGSLRFSSSEMDLVSDDAMECLEDRCSSWGPETDQCRARLVAVQESAAMQKIQRVNINTSHIPTFIVLC